MLTVSEGSRLPAIAINSNSTIHVVYDSLGDIYLKKSKDGGTIWSPAKRLSWTSGLSEDAAIAVDISNAIHVVWSDDTPGNWEVYYKSSADGGATWSPVQRLIWTSGRSERPALAGDLNNAIHIFWQDDTPGNYEIYYKKGS